MKAVTNKLGGLVSRDTVTVRGKRLDGMGMYGDITSQIHQMASYVDTMTGTSPSGFDYCNSLGYGANDYVTSVGAESPAVLAQKCSVYVGNVRTESFFSVCITCCVLSHSRLTFFAFNPFTME